MPVNDGTLSIRSGRERTTIKVRNGLVAERTTWSEGERTALKYGHSLKTERPRRKSILEEYYQPETLQAIKRGSLWKRQTRVQLCGSTGIVECFSTSSGAYGREVFTYDNGVEGYVASRWRKLLEVKRPNGKLWIVITGKVGLSRQTLAERLNTGLKDLDVWYWIRGNSWDITMYDSDGVTVVTQGCIKGRQKQGKWIEKGKVTYYMSGVKVSRQLYEEDPAKWDAREVLHVPNAQLRCSLLNRMGYDKLLEKVQPRIIGQGDDGGQLLEIDSGLKADNGSGVDNAMRLVKVICPSTSQIYVLRVPPEIADYEQARQWTFGLRQTSLQQGARFELVNET
jgi:hypothetical protein